MYSLLLFDLFGMGLCLFLLSIYGLLCLRTNLLFLLMMLETLFYSCNLLLLHSSLVFDDLGGQLFSVLVLTVAAVESTIGLAILVSFYKRRGVLVIYERTYIKG